MRRLPRIREDPRFAVGEQHDLVGVKLVFLLHTWCPERHGWHALGAAAITALVWSTQGLPGSAVVRTITVLVIACPHALGLAIPLVVSIATERAARARELEVPRAGDFSSSPAVGVRARVDDMVVEVGGPYLLEHHDLAELSIADTWREEGAIILHVLAAGAVIGALRLADEVRGESRETIDAQAVAETVARDLRCR